MNMKVNIELGKTNSVEAEWKNFTAKIFAGQTPSAVQLIETRKAFYAGFYSCLAVCFEIVADESEEIGAEILESLKEECEKFFKDELQNYLESKN